MEDSSFQSSVSSNGPTDSGKNDLLKRLFRLIPLLILAVVGWWIVSFFFGDQIFPNSVRGYYVTSTYIPTGVNQGKTFLLTEGFIFNRIYYGFYQHGKSDLEGRQTVDYSQETPVVESYWVNGKIWLIGRGGSKKSNELKEIDPETGKVLMNLSDLEKTVPEFKQGILTTSLPNETKEDLNFIIDLSDGSSWRYFPGVGKAFESYSKYLKWLGDNQTEAMIEPAQGVSLTHEIPQKLVRFSGPMLLVKAAKTASTPNIDSNLSHQLTAITHKDFTADNTLKVDSPFGDVNFVEGEILYQDSEYALILHQQTADDLSPRVLSLINISKATISTINEDQMLWRMRVNPHDDFSSLFFIKDNVSAARGGDLIFFKYRRVGTLAIDVNTGKVVWSLDGLIL